MSYTSSVKSSSKTVAGAGAAKLSGVQGLNNDLANLFDRIQEASRRVNAIADQFGAPSNPSEGYPDAPTTNTNEHMSNLSRALSWLEGTISRIDNQ